jgi:hypothetical protein
MQGITAFAQDHLEPADNIFSILNYELIYYSKVREKLFSGLSDLPETRFLLMPSFSGEKILDIEKSEKDGTYQLILQECESSIWYAEKKDAIKVIKTNKKITKASAQLVHTLYLKATSLGYPKENLLGNDGTNYYFMARDFGLKSGTVWSPSKNSNIAELVSISNDIMELEKKCSRAN